MNASRRFAVGLLTVLGLAAGGHTRPPAPAADELRLLNGTWALHAYAVDGRDRRGEDPRTTLTVEGDRWTIRWQRDHAGEQVEKGTVRVIDAAGRPKVVDLVHDHGPYKGTTTRAFYQVDGDTLRYSSVVAPENVADARVVTATTTWKRLPR